METGTNLQHPESATGEAQAPWSILTSITFHPAETRWQIRAEFSREANRRPGPKGIITVSAYSPLELTTILHALGTGLLSPQEESIEDFKARGGKITFCPPRFAAGTANGQNALRLPLPSVGKSEKKARPQLTEEQLQDLMATLNLISL